VHLTAIHPDTNEFYYFKNGAFQLYKPLLKTVPTITNVFELIENTKEMQTNDIMEATQENIPIHILK
jgi:hypothetical protein